MNYDEIKHQNLIKEEGKELVAIRDNDYNKVEQYLKAGGSEWKYKVGVLFYKV